MTQIQLPDVFQILAQRSDDLKFLIVELETVNIRLIFGVFLDGFQLRGQRFCHLVLPAFLRLFEEILRTFKFFSKKTALNS